MRSADDEQPVDPMAGAWHEAGHAVVAHLLGGEVQTVSLEPEEDELEGRASVLWSGVDPRSLARMSIAVALAGPAAEWAYQGGGEPEAESAQQWGADWREVELRLAELSGDAAEQRRMLLELWAETQRLLADADVRERVARVAEALEAHGTLDRDLFLDCWA